MKAVEHARRSWLIWACLVLSAVSLYIRLFAFPFVPVWSAHSDQVIYLTNAVRLLNHEVIFRDFFHFLPPGTEVVYTGLMAALGPRPWIPNLALVGLGLLQVGLTLAIARRFMSDWAAAVAALVYVSFCYRNLDGVHHWFSATVLAAALYVLTGGQGRARLIVTGLLLGLTSFITPVKGLLGLVAVGVFLIYKQWRAPRPWRTALPDGASFAAAYAGSLGLAMMPFVLAAGLSNTLYCTVTYVSTNYFLDDRYNNLSNFLSDFPTSLREAPEMFVYVLPLAFLAFLPLYGRLRRRGEAFADAVLLVWLVGVFQILGVIRYVTSFRLSTTLLPATIVFFLLLDGLRRGRRPLLLAMSVAALLMALARPIALRRPWTFFQARAGEIAFRPTEAVGLYEWMKDHTREGDEIFDANSPNFYYLLKLSNPTEMSFVAPNLSTLPAQVSRLVESLESHHVRLVLWTVNRLKSGRNDPLPPLRAYLSSHYHVAATFDDPAYRDTIQVLEREPSGSP